MHPAATDGDVCAVSAKKVDEGDKNRAATDAVLEKIAILGKNNIAILRYKTVTKTQKLCGKAHSAPF